MRRTDWPDIAIIENTTAARDEHGRAWGAGDVVLSREHMRALRQGKALALFDGEYMTFLSTREPKQEEDDAESNDT